MAKVYVATTNRRIKPSKYVIDLQWHGVIDEYSIDDIFTKRELRQMFRTTLPHKIKSWFKRENKSR